MCREPLHATACHGNIFAVHLLPDPIGTVHLEVGLSDPLNVRNQALIALGPGAAQFRVACRAA
jgi:hypothetical protein